MLFYYYVQPCKGVNALSPLYILPDFDIVNGVTIDYMHCLLEGVAKKLLKLWLKAGNPYYIGRQTTVINERLHAIRPPDTVTRTPRDITMYHHWKGTHMYTKQIGILQLCCYLFPASEYRTWILYYSLPVLSGVLPLPYYEHLRLFVCSLHILLSSKITQEMLVTAEDLLDKFYLKFQQLYGMQ